jgi:hypothetical protein
MSETKPIEIKNIVTDGHARKMGRMCCGGRCMTVKQDGEVKDAMFIEQSNFEGYNCMVNWFFLHIEQDRDAVYHHQTCMGKLEGSPEANIDPAKFGDIIKKFGPNKGPITHCGCGICIAKAKDDDDFKEIASKYIEVGEIG